MARGRQVDPEEVTHEEGALLVRLARESVEYWFKHREKMPLPRGLPEKLLRPGAAFVTIERYLEGGRRELRGCIGYVRAFKSLAETVVEVALESAFRDPRFPPMEEWELDHVTFEVSVLSPLEEAPRDPEGRLRFIVVGRDGVVVERGAFSGLLLPVVPVEYLWDEETFLSETCVKAGLWPDCWLDPETRVYRYRARAWRESRPRGPVEYRDLRRELEEALRRYGGG
ncbi:MAG: AmmeMemoRadiSam system protein A [Desulfurococcales archaeon]|nr:AmmeMemoRadiSam system protein A [Desulfurococcales archaeon]